MCQGEEAIKTYPRFYLQTNQRNLFNDSDYDVEPNAAEPPREAVDLSDLLKVLASRIEDFRDLLVVPRSVVWNYLEVFSSTH